MCLLCCWCKYSNKNNVFIESVATVGGGGWGGGGGNLTLSSLFCLLKDQIRFIRGSGIRVAAFKLFDIDGDGGVSSTILQLLFFSLFFLHKRGCTR